MGKNKDTFIAPGRICLFGDHQDYLGLPVIACAIDRYIQLTGVTNKTGLFKIRMDDIDEERVIDINQAFLELKPRDYFASSLRVLRRYGCIPNIGYDITISGNIPINAGLSSSSALIIAWIKFLANTFGVDHENTPEFIAKVAHISEVLEHKEPGGMMDHYSIGIGNIIHINTSEPITYNIIGNELKGLVVGVSGVRKETVGGLANAKENALKAIGIVRENFDYFNLDKTEIEVLEKYKVCLQSELVPYFEAAIKNHHYTKQALKEFKKPVLDLKRIGELMSNHHTVLRDLLKITVPRIDDIIDAALKAGAYGAKIVGSGGGGCIVAIAKPGCESLIVDAIIEAGAQEAYQVSVDSGASKLN